MKRLLFSTLLLLSAPLAAAETPSYLLKTGASSVSVKEIKSLDASGLVSLAGHSAIEFLNDGTLTRPEAEALLGFLDVERVSRFTLGRYARSLSEAEFARFEQAFKNYASNQFQSHLSGFAGGDLRIVETINRKVDDAVVKTEVRTADGKVQRVNWRVLKRDDTWNVVDVEALGFWFAIEQRAQFTATLDKSSGNIDALIDNLSSQD